jgi:IS605 OrfB family transposase
MRDYNKGKITKAALRDARLFPFYVIGEKVKQGNRNLTFDVIENDRIIIKPFAGTKIPVYFPKLHKNYSKILRCLEIAAKHNGLPITLKMTEKDIQLTYDESKLYAVPEVIAYLDSLKNPTKPPKLKKEALITNFIKTRHAGIDMNPGFIGFSIWEDGNDTPIFKMQYDLSELNVASGKPSHDPLSKHIVNKRHHETIEIAKDIVKYLIHYGVPLLTLENLKFDTGDQGKGKEFNKLCKNVWNRNIFIENITKRCRNNGIALKKVHPAYTTFIGNVMYPTLPDPIAASAEIARRGYKNTKEDHEFYPPILNSALARYQSVKNQLDRQHEGDLEWTTWKDLYDACVHAGMRYRVATPPERSGIFSCKSKVTSVIFK